MHKDSYNPRLREIRDKYGPTVKETTCCLRTVDGNLIRPQSRYDNKQGMKIKSIQPRYERNNHQNVDPFLRAQQNKKTDCLSMQNNQFKKYDSSIISKTNNHDQRLRQIEKIRQEYAESRKQTIDDWSREVERSKNQYLYRQSQRSDGKYAHRQSYGARDKTSNKIQTFNPQDLKCATKQTYLKQHLRTHTQSYSTQIQQRGLERKFQRDYEYSDTNKKNRQDEHKPANTLRNNCIMQTQRSNVASSITKQIGYSANAKGLKKVDSQTTSPIKGLMRFDSVQKNKPTQFPQHSYDLTNIDRIQQRIQKMLGKK